MNDPVLFGRRDAERISRSVQIVERLAPRLQNPGSTPRIQISGEIRFGKPTSAFSSGATVTLDPCTIDGTDTGEDNQSVYIQASQASVDLDDYDIDSDSVVETTGCSVGTGTILQFTMGASGNWYLTSPPQFVVTRLKPDNTNFTLQAKGKWALGGNYSSESGWLDWLDDGEEC